MKLLMFISSDWRTQKVVSSSSVGNEKLAPGSAIYIETKVLEDNDDEIEKLRVKLFNLTRSLRPRNFTLTIS